MYYFNLPPSALEKTSCDPTYSLPKYPSQNLTSHNQA